MGDEYRDSDVELAKDIACFLRDVSDRGKALVERNLSEGPLGDDGAIASPVFEDLSDFIDTISILAGFGYGFLPPSIRVQAVNAVNQERGM